MNQHHTERERRFLDLAGSLGDEFAPLRADRELVREYCADRRCSARLPRHPRSDVPDEVVKDRLPNPISSGAA